MPHKKSKEGYLSVTEVLNVINKPYLLYWYGKNGIAECERIKRESQEIGTLVHAEIEHLLKGEKTESDDKTVKSLLKAFFNKFLEPYKVEAIKLEETIEDEELKLQGTFDALVKTKKGLFVADWKTSNSIDKVTVPLQLSAYAYLAKNVNNGIVVRLDKKTHEIEIKEYKNLAQYWPIFRSCLTLARYVKDGINEKEV